MGLEAVPGLAAGVGRLRGAVGALGGCWAGRVYRLHALVEDVTPTIGQWWYVFMEAFEDSKVCVFGKAPPPPEGPACSVKLC